MYNIKIIWYHTWYHIEQGSRCWLGEIQAVTVTIWHSLSHLTSLVFLRLPSNYFSGCLQVLISSMQVMYITSYIIGLSLSWWYHDQLELEFHMKNDNIIFLKKRYQDIHDLWYYHSKISQHWHEIYDIIQ